SGVPSKLPAQGVPDAAPRPANKGIINRCRRTILGRAITPATAAFQHMHNSADHAANIPPLDPAYICRQMRFDPLPLLIAKPKQVPGHDPNPLPKTNQDRIVRAEKLMSSDPRITQFPGGRISRSQATRFRGRGRGRKPRGSEAGEEKAPVRTGAFAVCATGAA